MSPFDAKTRSLTPLKRSTTARSRNGAIFPLLGSNTMMPFLWSVMKARPSLWNLRPLGSPSYSSATVTAPSGAILKRRPQGMSVTHRFPARSKDGPSRKVGVFCPIWLNSTQCEGRSIQSRSGMRAYTVVSMTGGAANMRNSDALDVPNSHRSSVLRRASLAQDEDFLFWYKQKFPNAEPASAPKDARHSTQKIDLSKVAPHAGMDELDLRRGGDRVGGGGLTGLRQTAREPAFGAVERAGEPIGEGVGKAIAGEDQAPGADGGDGCVLSFVAAGGEGQRFQKPVLFADAPDLVRTRCDEACTGGALGDRREPRPSAAAAPERRDAAVEHHRRPVAGAVEVDGAEIPLAIEPKPVEHRARQQDEPGATGAERDRRAAQVRDGAIGTVGTRHEQAGRRVHGGDDPKRTRGAAGLRERLARDLALHQRDVEHARAQQRHVLGAALGVTRLNDERWVDVAHGFNQRRGIEREAATWRRRAEDHGVCWALHQCGYPPGWIKPG